MYLPLADCWFVTGPTAAGKTRVGIELTKLLGGAEIISLDSMAVYRGLDLGTAKPTPDERLAAPHHLVDIREPEEEFSLAEFVAAAESAAGQITAHGHEPIVVGGTPLYLKALLRGIFEGPPADWEFRRELERQAQDEAPGWLHARLSAVDAVTARRLHPSDHRRVIRALEVFAKTGQPISELQRQFDRARPADACRVFVLDWPRDELLQRIDRRVDAMFASGLVEEVESLLARGKRFGRTAAQAVGYREVFEYLEDMRSLTDTIDLVKLRTRQFAKRQLTWFRSLSECRWVPISLEGEFDPAEAANRILLMGDSDG